MITGEIGRRYWSFLPYVFFPPALDLSQCLCTAALYLLQSTVNGIQQRPYLHYMILMEIKTHVVFFRYPEREDTPVTKADLVLLAE